MINSPATLATAAAAYARDPSSALAAEERQRELAGTAEHNRPNTRDGAGDDAQTNEGGSAQWGTTDHNLQSLATAVGLDPKELLDQVTSGQGISNLLGMTGQTGYGSTVGDSVRGGIVLDLYA